MAPTIKDHAHAPCNPPEETMHDRLVRAAAEDAERRITESILKATHTSLPDSTVMTGGRRPGKKAAYERAKKILESDPLDKLDRSMAGSFEIDSKYASTNLQELREVLDLLRFVPVQVRTDIVRDVLVYEGYSPYFTTKVTPGMITPRYEVTVTLADGNTPLSVEVQPCPF